MLKTNASKARGADLSPELAAKARAGDQAAFAELYEQTHRELYRTIHSMVRDEDLAWDILQDSYIRAWRGLDKLENPGAFLPWLRRIAVNVTATAMTQKRVLRFTEMAADEDEGEPEFPDLNPENQPELALDRQESSRLVREILAGLPEAQQLILGMHYYEDMPVKDIAEALQIAPGTVKAQLWKGRKKVETAVRALEKQGVKLYGLSPLPFLLALLRRLEPSAQAEKAALTAVLRQTPATSGTVAAGGAGAAAAGEAATVTAMTAGQAFLHGIGTKLLAGALAIAVLVGCGKLAYDALKKGYEPPVGPEQPTTEESITPVDTGNTVPTEYVEANSIPENACGPNLTWRFDDDAGTLIIEGNGDMYDYGVVYDYGEGLIGVTKAPWSPVMNQVIKIEILEGVTSIGAQAFYQCEALAEVMIQEGLQSIGEKAFSDCHQLRSITFPDSLRSIGEDAFMACKGLRTVTLPKGMTTVGDGAFYGCSGLQSVTISSCPVKICTNAFTYCSNMKSFTVDPENPNLSSDENGVLYNKDRTTLLVYPGKGSGDYVIPSGVTAIGDYAFMGRYGLSSVMIPEGVVSIGKNAFASCSMLRSVRIPESVSFIGEFAFSYCSSLTTFDAAPENMSFSTDEAGVLFNQDKTVLIAFPGGKSGEYEIPEGVVSVENQAFYACDGLNSVTAPKSLRSIGAFAFFNCENLREVTLCEGVRSIEERVFSDCYGLISITIPESVTAIGENALCDCPELTIHGVPGSAAERYANENGIPFKAISFTDE